MFRINCHSAFQRRTSCSTKHPASPRPHHNPFRSLCIYYPATRNPRYGNMAGPSRPLLAVALPRLSTSLVQRYIHNNTVHVEAGSRISFLVITCPPSSLWHNHNSMRCLRGQRPHHSFFPSLCIYYSVILCT